MNKSFYFSMLVVLFSMTAAHADRVYKLVNYPDLQNGHTLSGTITTSDDAPDDGLLSTAEILDWHWSVTGPNAMSASLTPMNPGSTTVYKISISDSSIQLPLDEIALLILQHFPESNAPSGSPYFSLDWRTFLNSQGQPSPQYSFRYPDGRDSHINIWFAPLVNTGDAWTIARIVPEPFSDVLLGTIAFTLMLIRLARPTHRA